MKEIDNIVTLDTSRPVNENELIDISKLSLTEREALCSKLLQEQIIEQRNSLHYWSEITNQPSQIDSGYIGQHLVSVITGIKGGGMRGKGLDLEDGSEIKTANFLDSLDDNNATAPRWNFPCNDIEQMKCFLEYPSIYLVSIDLRIPEVISIKLFEDKLKNQNIPKSWLNTFNDIYIKNESNYVLEKYDSLLQEEKERIRRLFSRINYEDDNIRIRVWRVIPSKHKILKNRYEEWMCKLGYPKLNKPGRAGVNFQLFPPHYFSNDNFARHGNDRKNGFKSIKLELENTDGAEKIFEAIEVNNKIQIEHIKL